MDTNAKRDRRHTFALGVWLATLVVGLAATAFVVAGLSAEIGTVWGFPGFGVLLAVTFGTIGLLISVRVPGNRFGWLFAFVGLASALQELIAGYVVQGGLVSPGSLPWIEQVAWFETWDWVPVAGGATTFLLLLFPDGRLLSKRWRPVAWLAIGSIALVSGFLSIQPGPIDSAEFVVNPLGVSGVDAITGPLGGAGFIALILAVLLSAVSMVVRFRRSRAAEREQLKWFASAAILAGLVFAGLGAADSANKGFQILTVFAFMGMPVSAGIAILRYRLYDIDRIVSNALGYAVVTIILFAIFAVVNLALQGALSSFTNGDTLSVAVSTLFAAALFNPVRSRVQRAADRRFHRARYDGDRAASAFSERMRDELDLETIRRELVATVGESIQPRAGAVWIRPSRRTR
ncbi:MAG: hypothetical protein H0V73_04935 [Chloroflexi bacterium]|nr:hypothetical protein [Chloroflexota bacterium]